MSCKSSIIDCISTAQVRWNTKRLFNSNAGIFSRNWDEEKKKKLPDWEDWINSFISREFWVTVNVTISAVFIYIHILSRVNMRGNLTI